MTIELTISLALIDLKGPMRILVDAVFDIKKWNKHVIGIHISGVYVPLYIYILYGYYNHHNKIY